MPTLETHNGYPLWHYIPNLPAAIVFIIMFGVLTLAHAWKLIRYRMWFCIPVVIGGILEITGYIGRALAYNATGSLLPFVLQSTLLLLAPILFAASLYMTLSRLIVAVNGVHCSIIAPRWLTRIFVFGDVFSLIIQASGAGVTVMAAGGGSSGGGSPMNPELGSHIILGGLIFQIVVFGIFITTAMMFHVKFARDHEQAARMTLDPSRHFHEVPWQSMLVMLYVTSVFIIIRNIFRVVEYAMGNDGYLLGVEWSVYVFDAALMVLTMATFLWRYPNQLRVDVSKH